MLEFGTDGVRGPVGSFTRGWVMALGWAAADVLGPGTFIVGRDTRASGPDIASWLADGLRAGGCGVLDLAVAPTPAVAWAAAHAQAPAAMVSASHNPWTDNGVKLFAAGGLKLDDDTEQRLSLRLAARLADMPDDDAGAALTSVPGAHDPAAMGSLDATAVAWRRQTLDGYLDHVVGSLHGRDLTGLSVVLDCANGAASELAPGLFERLGATVTVLHASPDGRNINANCGSTHMGDLCAAVTAAGADLGLALDGDADRVLAVDGTGTVVDGDQIIAVLALDRFARGLLPGGAVVVTVMSNLGLRLAMADAGISVVETPVGDRHCLAALESHGLVLGGEQSGHVIFRDLATTGDGMLSGVQLADVLVRSGVTLAELAGRAMTRLPQVLHNVEVHAERSVVMDAIADEVAAQQALLGDTGRVLVRPSGTEPLVRVMVEAPDVDVATDVAAHLADVIASVASNQT
jgi:phosphoglucosamine mutase